MSLDIQKDVVIWLQSFRNVFTEFFFSFVSFFGDPEFYIILLAFVYWVLSKKAGEFMAIALGTTVSLNNLLKGVFMINRPFQTYPEIENLRDYAATGSSFPSGHVQNSATLFFSLAMYFKKRYLWVLAIVLSVLMSLSRLFLGLHYPIDVVVGALLGLAVPLLFYVLFKHFSDRLPALYTLIVLLFFPAFFFITENDFFRGYGILVGFILAILFEKRYVNFSMQISPLKKLLRYGIGLIFIVLTMELIGLFFGIFTVSTFWANTFDFIRFFFVAFVGFGLYPMFFKRFNF